MQELQLVRGSDARQTADTTAVWTLPWEWVVYVALAGLALLLFSSELHLVPLSADEARQALTAWRFVDATAPGVDAVPASPLLFFAQSTTFALFGGGEGYARIATALAGAALVLAPALLRGSLGASRALLLSALLACSPVVIVAARTSAPMIWAALLALLTLWAGGRFWATRARGWAIAALVFLALLMFMTEPGGTLLGLTLLVAVVMSRLSGGDDEQDDADDEASEMSARLAQALREFPWGLAFAAAALVVIALSTLFLTHPPGLTAVGNVLLNTVSGFAQRGSDTLSFFPMLISIFYEPWLWILAIGVAYWVSRGNNPAPTFLDRVAIIWLALNAVISLLFLEAEAEHALWLTLPLALLSSRLALVIFAPIRDETPAWAQWLVAVLALGLLAMGSLAFQGAARSIARIDFSNPAWAQQVDVLGLVILLIVLAFAVVGYFLVRSFWENRSVPLRAGTAALLTFAAFTGIGAGWRTAVTEADNPVDFWQRSAPSREGLLLRESLMDLAERTSRGFTEMPITVISAGDPLIEWAVRDFSAARFVSGYDEVGSAPVLLVLANSDFDRSPPLEGNYVGQDFVLSRRWTLDNLRPVDVPQWWSQHRALNTFAAVPNQAILWVRTDVYAGVAR